MCWVIYPDILSFVLGKVDINKILGILRDEAGSINFVGELLTVGSQISVISPPTSGHPSCHWFTATPNTKYSVFKPFVFCDHSSVGNWTVSPSSGETSRPVFQSSIDRRHLLYRAHEKGKELMQSGSPLGQTLQKTMQDLEEQCVREVSEFLKTFKESDINDVKDLFSDIAESEAKLYNWLYLYLLLLGDFTFSIYLLPDIYVVIWRRDKRVIGKWIDRHMKGYFCS